MILTAILLIVSLAIILVAAELFTNAVEWLGHKLNLNEGVVGSILAAVGTAMPETMIPVVAILYTGGEHGHEVGVGAILGAPFMLATLAMFITGLAVVGFARGGRRTTELRVNSKVLGRDIRFFLIGYLLAIVAAFVPIYAFKVAIAIVVVGLYVYYVYKHATDSEEAPMTYEDMEGMSPLEAAEELAGQPEHLAPLHFQRWKSTPRFWVVCAQLVVSLAIMLVGAYMFVEQVTAVALAIGIPALILSLLIAPVATELPEKMNSVLWVRQGKDTLALGNLTGAMVFQSCIPAAFGMVFGEWAITAESTSAFVSAGIAILAAAVIFGSLNFGGRKLTANALLTGGVFYVAYVVYLLVAGGAHA
ncbi:MAG: sodium:calcium antiporter [Chloroflexi bacterium]|nr:sodium:calcium antiporter [Chloroflexota bacterium]